MAKIICITTGLTGILNASFELMSRLQNAGHEVSCAAPRNVKEKVVQEGWRFIQLPEIQQDASPKLPDYRGVLKKVKRFFYKIKNAKQRKKAALENTIPLEFITMLERESPDLILIDIELHEYIFAAYAQKQKFILLSQWFSLWNRKGLPYLLHDTIPSKGWKGSNLAIAFSWWKIRRQRSWMFFRKKILSGGTDRRSILLELAKKYNFPTKYIQKNYWPGPFTYDQLPVISLTAFEMEFPHDPRPNLHYIGPMVFDKRKEKPSQSSTGYSIEEVFDYKNKIGGVLLYCSLSTLSKGDEFFIKKIIKAVKHQKKWVLIIGMGGLIDGEKFRDLPGNVFAFSYVPQLQVLKYADISINHGGIHTINECVYFKVPMLVYSGKRSDQNGCAARVAYYQLGLMGDKDKDSPEEIRKKINKVLTDKDIEQNINTFNTHFFKYKKEKRLEHFIESF